MTNHSITVPFHGVNLFVVNFNGQPYTPMKPIVEGMGMAWQSQLAKIKSRFPKGITEIVIPSAGGDQSMICLALRKLSAWLSTISPNKVRPEIRDKVIQYQNECDDVLYEYWTTGEVKRKTTTVDQRTPLRDAINMLVGKKGLMYPEAYGVIHQRFGVDHIDELSVEMIPQAIEYVHRLALDGEYIPKSQNTVDTRLLVTIKNGIRNERTLRPDEHVSTLEAFFDLARKAKYIVVHVDDLQKLAVVH